jgi:hypothetical protein
MSIRNTDSGSSLGPRAEAELTIARQTKASGQVAGSHLVFFSVLDNTDSLLEVMRVQE